MAIILCHQLKSINDKLLERFRERDTFEILWGDIFVVKPLKG